MKHLKSLVLMQLKDKIDFSFLKSKKKTISKIVFTILGFVAIVAVCYVLFYASSLLRLFSSLPMVPISVMVVIYTLMFLLSCITCSFGLMKAMFMSTDNQVLLTLPVKPNMVFVSKLIVYYIYELIKNAFFVLPVFLAYGFFSGFSTLFYPWLIICFLFITALPVLIGAVVSIPLMAITSLLRQLPYVRMFLYALVVGGIITLAVMLISAIPENINIISSWGTIYWAVQDFLADFTQIFTPITWLVNMVCGYFDKFVWVLFNINTLWVFLGVIAANIVLFGMSFFLSRPLFFKMASSPFEYKKKNIKKSYKNKKRKTFSSALLKEFKTSFRKSEFIYNYATILIVLPLAIFLLNKIFNAMNTKLLGTYMTYSFNILMIMLILLASNAIIASIYSSEGRTAYLQKTLPHKHSTYLFPKLVMSLVLTAISSLVTVIIFSVFAKVGVGNAILMYLIVMGFYSGHLFWSAELDLMNPQNEQYATTGTSVSNPNEKKSTILAFMISALVFIASLLLFMEGVDKAFIKLGAIAVVFAVVRVYLYFTRIKIYYAEK